MLDTKSIPKLVLLQKKKVSLRSGIQRVTQRVTRQRRFLFNFNHVRTGSYNYKRSMGYISRMRYINSSSKAMIIQPREKELNKKIKKAENLLFEKRTLHVTVVHLYFEFPLPNTSVSISTVVLRQILVKLSSLGKSVVLHLNKLEFP